MLEQFSRTELLLGRESMEKLKNSSVAVFGIGGVGSYTAEALVRTGIGRIILVDYDIIDISNLNRQIHATLDTVGMKKTQAMKERLLSINKDLDIEVIDEKYSEDNKDMFFKEEYDYIVDAIDMVSSKLSLIENSKRRNIRVISCMGAGNKLRPDRLRVSDIYDTYECPLAKVMRRELKKRQVRDLKVVWSDEKPIKTGLEKENLRKSVPGSTSFVPPVAGMIVAGEVVSDLIGGV